MVRHWPPCAISERASCFMYKGKLSLYTRNTVASHYTCKALKKSCRMVNVIRYRGSTSRSNLSIGFVSPSAPCLSYTVNKHKWMAINTLFVTNHSLIILKNKKKRNICSEKRFTRCVGQARKVLSVCPTNWTSWVGTGTRASISQTSSTSTLTWSLPKGVLWMVVDPS